MDTSLILHTRFGDKKKNPTETELVEALDEIFNENLENLSEADYKEHPNAWLIYGHEDGESWTEYTLDVYRGGTIRFTKYKDVDDDDPEFEYSISNAKKDNAIELWKMICDGSIDDTLKRFISP